MPKGSYCLLLKLVVTAFWLHRAWILCGPTGDDIKQCLYLQRDLVILYDPFDVRDQSIVTRDRHSATLYLPGTQNGQAFNP